MAPPPPLAIHYAGYNPEQLYWKQLASDHSEIACHLLDIYVAGTTNKTSIELAKCLPSGRLLTAFTWYNCDVWPPTGRLPTAYICYKSDDGPLLPLPVTSLTTGRLLTDTTELDSWAPMTSRPPPPLLSDGPATAPTQSREMPRPRAPASALMTCGCRKAWRPLGLP